MPRAHDWTRLILTLALLVAAAGFGLAAAQEATPTASHPLVGTWNVTDPTGTTSVIAFTGDGFVVDTAPGGGTGYGSWNPTGPDTAAFTLVIQSAETTVLRGTIRVSADGDAFTATYDYAVGSGGALGDRGTGQATATRVSKEPATAAGTPVAVGPSTGGAPPAAQPAGPALQPVSPVGLAPTIRVAGNRFVDGNGTTIRLLGVNFAGVEGACVAAGFQLGATDAQPGPVFDYQGPGSVVVPGQPPRLPEAFFGELAAWHVNAVRFMVNEMCWLGRPPNPKNNPEVAPIPEAHYDSAAYRKAIVDFVASLHRYGMIAVAVLGDNPCPYHWPDGSATIYDPPGSEFSPCDDADQIMPDAANAPDFWASFAQSFKGDHSMVFELFNEPHINVIRPAIDFWGCWRNGCDIPGEGWHAAGMQQLVDAIRGAGATQPILVPGMNYSGVIYRPAYAGGPAVGWIVPGAAPQDALNPPQLAVANHMYDDTYDKTDVGCLHGSGPECWDNVLGIVAAQVPLVTTELGEHDCATSSAFVDRYMDWADTLPASGRDRVSYLAWTFNADYNCNAANATLLTGWDGTPTVMGLALRERLTKNDGR
jgi:hypothetical protein